MVLFFFFQAEDGIRDLTVTGVQTCALPISRVESRPGGKSIPTAPAGQAHLPVSPSATRRRRSAIHNGTRDPRRRRSAPPPAPVPTDQDAPSATRARLLGSPNAAADARERSGHPVPATARFPASSWSVPQ